MEDWIPFRIALLEDPRVIRIAADLDRSEFEVAGMLLRLWGLGNQHTEDGIIEGLTVKALDRRVNCPGFSAALVAVDWLVVLEGGVQIPRFDKYNSSTAKSRAMEARRKAAYRKQEEEKRRERKQRGTSRPEDDAGTFVPIPSGQPADTCPTESGTITGQCPVDDWTATGRRRDSGVPSSAPRTTTRTTTTLPPPPQTPPASEATTAWRALTAAVAAAGVQDLDCLKAALNAGLTHADCHAIIEFYETTAKHKGYGPAALHKRLTKAEVGLPLSHGWPKPDPKVEAQQQAARQQQQQVVDVQQEQARKQAQEAAKRQREETFGPVLDALPDEEQEALARSVSADLERRWKQIGASGVVRTQLLLVLERRAVGVLAEVG